MKAYRDEFPADFPAGSDEAEQMDEIAAVLALIDEYSGDQALNFGNARFLFNAKGIARENLREELEDMETAARIMAYKIAGVDLIFRVPHDLSDAAMLALARSFAEQSGAYKDEFEKRLGNAYLADLQAAIAAFDESLTPPASATEARVEATARLGEAVRRGMVARRILQALMKLKYKTNPARMRAWLSASHLERDKGEEEEDAPIA
jgi:hypothetical protein